MQAAHFSSYPTVLYPRGLFILRPASLSVMFPSNGDTKVTPVKLGVLPMQAKPSVPRVTRKCVIRSASCAGIVTCCPLFFVECSLLENHHFIMRFVCGKEVAGIHLAFLLAPSLSTTCLTISRLPSTFRPSVLRCHQDQPTIFNRIDEVTELLKLFLVMGYQENCFSIGFKIDFTFS